MVVHRAVVLALLLGPWAFTPPAGAQASDGPVVLLTDDVGDATVPEDASGNHPSSVLDVESLTLARETDDALVFAIKLAHLALTNEYEQALYHPTYVIGFEIPDLEKSYRLTIEGALFRNSGDAALRMGTILWADMCADPVGETACGGRWFGFAKADGTARSLSVEVPKLALSELRASDREEQLDLREGTRLAQFTLNSEARTWCSGITLPPCIPWRELGHDEAGPAGEYALRSPGPSPFLRLSIGTAWNGLSLLPETNQTVRFSLVNLAPEKRVVKLSFGIEAGSPLASAFEVHGPPAVLIGAQQTRNYTFTVKTPALDPTQGWPNLTARAEVPSGAEYRPVKVQLVAGYAMTPQENKYYLHAVESPPGPVADTQVRPPCLDSCLRTELSHLRALPGSKAEGRAPLGARMEGDENADYLWTNMRLTRPVPLDPEGRVEFRLFLGGQDVDLEEATILMELVYTDTGFVTIASATTTEDLTKEGKAITLSAKPRAIPGKTIPAGANVVLRYLITVPSPSPICCAEMRGAWAKPIDSHIILPVLDLPDYAIVAPNPSPFQISLLDERENFVNAGESRLVNFTVTNIDVYEQRLDIAVNTTDPAWAPTVLPGSRFILPPGDSVRVGILVRAPTDAPEGARVTATLLVRADDGSVRSDRFVVTATQLEMADDVDAFEADREDEAKLVREVKPTPSASGVFVLGLLVALARVARRRPSTRPPKG